MTINIDLLTIVILTVYNAMIVVIDNIYCVSYDTAYQQFGYDYSSGPELVEKQGTGPTPADFIPFFASFSLPLSAALATFLAIIVVCQLLIADN